MPEYTYKCCCLVLFIVRVTNDSPFLARLNHIEAHIESFHRIVPVDLAVFALRFFFFALRHSLQSSMCKRHTGGVIQLQVWAELGLGRCFPVKCLEQRVNVVFASFARFAGEFQYSIIKKLSKTF